MWAWLNNYDKDTKVYDPTNVTMPTDRFIANAFTEAEKNGISSTIVYTEDLSNNRNGATSYFGSPVTTISQDKLFIPSYNEMLNTKYGFAGTYNNSNTRVLQNTAYSNAKDILDSFWLRSRGDNYNYAYASFVDYYGLVSAYGGNVSATHPACAAALNLNQESVIFVSNAAESVKSGAVGAEAKKFILPTGYDNEYKLTMQGDHDGFSITNKPASLKKSAGSEIELNYTGAKFGGDEYVSMILTQEKTLDNNLKCDEVKYYGKLVKVDNDNLKSGTAKIKLPSDLEAGNYKLKIFAEQCNGDKKTDWASATQDINLEVLKVDEFEVSPIAHRVGYEQEVKATLKGENFDVANKLTVEFVDEDGTTKLSHEAAINTGDTEKTITFSADCKFANRTL